MKEPSSDPRPTVDQDGPAAPPKSGRPTTRHRWRLVMEAILLLLLLFALFDRCGVLERAPTDAELLELLAAARQCMDQRAWDEPAGKNLQAIALQLSERWPGDPRVAALKREAAERLLAEALHLEYTGNRKLARERIRLALQLAPDSLAAQGLDLELQQKGSRPDATAAPGLLPTRSAIGPGVDVPALPAPMPSDPVP